MKIKETFLTIDPPSGWKYGFPKIVTQEQYKSIKNLKQWCIDNGYSKAEADSYGDYFHIQINGDLSFTLMNEKPLTRELAADWFASKSYLEQHSLSDKYFESRHPSLLTIEQVEEIWKKETQVAYCEKVTCNNSDCKSGCKELKYRNKSNQKQSPADEIIELVGENNFKQIIKESDKRVNQKQYPEETFGLASETTTREQALAYFNSLPSDDQQMLTYRYFNERHRQSLTGREIEEIWRKECNQIEDEVFKPNQKQFKQFDESLHKAYLNKFSEEDKFKAFISNLNELSKEIQFNAFLTTLKKMNLDSQTQSNIMTLVALRDI